MTTLFDADWSRDAALTDGVLGRRIAAFVVDGLLIAFLAGALWVLLLTFGLLTLGLGLPLLGLIPAVPFVYNWLALLGRGSATPGQRLFGLRVRRDADLGAPDAIAALAWSAGFAITVMLGAVWFAVALVTVRKRTLHDMVSGLVVVRASALTGSDRPLTGAGGGWNAARGGPAFE